MQSLTQRKTMVVFRQRYGNRVLVFVSCLVALLCIIIARFARHYLSTSSTSSSTNNSWWALLTALISGDKKQEQTESRIVDNSPLDASSNSTTNKRVHSLNSEDANGSTDKNSNDDDKTDKAEKRNTTHKRVSLHIVEDTENKHKSHEGRRHRDKATMRSSHHRRVDSLLPNMIILVGIHCCGKSYWAEEYISRVHKSYKLVSSDAIRKEITGSASDYSKEAQVEDEMLQQIRQLVEKKRSFIVDDCQHNLNEQFRLTLLEIAPENKYNRIIYLFPFTIFSARKRLENDLADKVDRYNASELELEELTKKFKEIESQYKEEGWIKYDIKTLREMKKGRE